MVKNCQLLFLMVESWSLSIESIKFANLKES